MKKIENYIAIDLKEVESKYTTTERDQKNTPTYWLVYSPEIVEIIDNYVADGHYPYNKDIEDLVHKNLFPHIEQDTENRTFSHIVYTSQSFRHERVDNENEILFEKQMAELGFCKATDELLKECAGTDKRFHVVMNTTNIFGMEGKKIVEKKFKLKDWGEQGLHWMDTRATRKGYRAYEGQFIKQL